jgi:hypothetical protein
MNIHRLIVFLPCLLVNKARTKAFNLHPCASLLLDVLDEHALIQFLKRGQDKEEKMMNYRRTDNFSTNVKIPYSFQTNGKLLLRPFALFRSLVSYSMPAYIRDRHTFSRRRSFLSSTNEPMSTAMSSLTLSIAFCRISFVVADMCR